MKLKKFLKNFDNEASIEIKDVTNKERNLPSQVVSYMTAIEEYGEYQIVEYGVVAEDTWYDMRSDITKYLYIEVRRRKDGK